MYLKKGQSRQKEQPGQKPCDRRVPASRNNSGGAGIRGGALIWVFTRCLWGMAREGAERPELIDVGQCLAHGDRG